MVVMGLEKGGWRGKLRELLAPRPHEEVHILGVGNPVKRDDSVGIYMALELRRMCGTRPRADVTIHPVSARPERLLSRLCSDGRRVAVLDAVECSREPGYVFCGSLSESRVGFFATHNLPLRLIPGMEGALAGAWVVGVQPEDLGVGEGLSATVRSSADAVVSEVREIMS